jgi:hypothetical protein
MEAFTWFSAAAFTVVGIKELTDSWGDKDIGVILILLAIGIVAIELFK